jgi:hypothetical protein
MTRQQAITAGAKTYTEKVCARHDSGERLTPNPSSSTIPRNYDDSSILFSTSHPAPRVRPWPEDAQAAPIPVAPTEDPAAAKARADAAKAEQPAAMTNGRRATMVSGIKDEDAAQLLGEGGNGAGSGPQRRGRAAQYLMS